MTAEVIEPQTEEVEPLSLELRVNREFSTELGKLGISEDELREDAAKALTITIVDINDKEGWKKADEARKNLKVKRVNIQKTGKFMRDEATKFSKKVIERENELVGLIDEAETYLDKRQKEIKDEKERLEKEKEDRIAAIFATRIAQLSEMGVVFNGATFRLGEIVFQMADVRNSGEELYEKVIFSPFMEEYKKIESVRIEQEKVRMAELQRAEEARLEAERLRMEAELALERQREEMRKQQEELRRQQEEFEAKRREAERIEEEKGRFLIEKRIKDLSIIGLSWIDRFQSFVFEDVNVAMVDVKTSDDLAWVKLLETVETEVASRKKEAKERLEKQEQERIAAIEYAAAQKERERIEAEQRAIEAKKQQESAEKAERLAMASDKEKWTLLVSALSAIKVPEMRSGQYRKKAMIAKERLEEIINQ